MSANGSTAWPCAPNSRSSRLELFGSAFRLSVFISSLKIKVETQSMQNYVIVFNK
ncbi:LdOrf-133 peptide [Lymantria dispar multiple nucleopolyhedrovirus]|uniref:LdOrf-133 peptide n=1 Tax=Lymantria dispar multicapsid nuclear polyhedrosis virus TaxID=10449 RepID=Q9YMJ4_NPVLD|nr:LdOrf-133 peptide [Lymantria dispar multiple nucleopolyhedrovirus]AAC70319.1 LdOrf-133 peptide [Lymantria dispar multiple nucleopolyhedrovirus]